MPLLKPDFLLLWLEFTAIGSWLKRQSPRLGWIAAGSQEGTAWRELLSEVEPGHLGCFSTQHSPLCVQLCYCRWLLCLSHNKFIVLLYCKQARIYQCLQLKHVCLFTSVPALPCDLSYWDRLCQAFKLDLLCGLFSTVSLLYLAWCSHHWLDVAMLGTVQNIAQTCLFCDVVCPECFSYLPSRPQKICMHLPHQGLLCVHRKSATLFFNAIIRCGQLCPSTC